MIDGLSLGKADKSSLLKPAGQVRQKLQYAIWDIEDGRFGAADRDIDRAVSQLTVLMDRVKSLEGLGRLSHEAARMLLDQADRISYEVRTYML